MQMKSSLNKDNNCYPRISEQIIIKFLSTNVLEHFCELFEQSLNNENKYRKPQ